MSQISESRYIDLARIGRATMARVLDEVSP
jgi:hypothetical protein